MKTKRILAASTAALLAFGTTAAYVASADDASSATSEATIGMTANSIVLAKATEKKVYKAHVEGKISGDDLDGLLTPAVTSAKTKYNATTGAADASGTLEVITSPEVVNGVAQVIEKVAQKADKSGYEAVTDKTGATDNSLNPYNNLSLAWWFNKSVGTSFKMTNAKIDVKVGGKVQKYNMDKSDPSNIVLSPDGTPVEASTNTVSKSLSGTITRSNMDDMKANSFTNLTDVDGAATTVPQTFQPAFAGLTETNQLVSVDTSKSEIVYSFDVEMNKADWDAFFTASGIEWDNNGGTDDGAEWSNITFEQLLAENGTKIATNLCGIVGNSWMSDGKTVAGGLAAKDGSAVKASNITDESTTVYEGMPTSGFVSVNVGTNANLQQLKAINEGGYLTFELDKALDPIKHVGIGTVMFYGTSGAIELPLSGTFTTSDDNTTFKFKLPAGLTYNEQLNGYNGFKVQYNIIINNLAYDNTSNGAANASFNVKTIKFESASAAASNNSGSTGTSGSGNGGNGGSGSTNPETGIALAIAPVVLAAGAVAVVALKKKH